VARADRAPSRRFRSGDRAGADAHARRALLSAAGVRLRPVPDDHGAPHGRAARVGTLVHVPGAGARHRGARRSEVRGVRRGAAEDAPLRATLRVLCGASASPSAW
jgi:hypothetical protein